MSFYSTRNRISPVPLALFVMLDEEWERELSVKVTKRKALTRNVLGRFDLSMPPQSLRTQGDGYPPCCSSVISSESPARRGKQGAEQNLFRGNPRGCPTNLAPTGKTVGCAKEIVLRRDSPLAMTIRAYKPGLPPRCSAKGS